MPLPPIYYIGVYLMPFLPFVFVFSLIVAIKLWTQDSLYFIGSGILASVSLLLMLYGLPLLVEIS